jgi:hypothetical protein
VEAEVELEQCKAMELFADNHNFQVD